MLRVIVDYDATLANPNCSIWPANLGATPAATSSYQTIPTEVLLTFCCTPAPQSYFGYNSGLNHLARDQTIPRHRVFYQSRPHQSK